MTATRHSGKSAAAFRTISEVADDLEVPQHVLRFWETKFSLQRLLREGPAKDDQAPAKAKSGLTAQQRKALQQLLDELIEIRRLLAPGRK
jgi:DNA-binding transcriptional MerR regulator